MISSCFIGININALFDKNIYIVHLPTGLSKLVDLDSEFTSGMETSSLSCGLVVDSILLSLLLGAENEELVSFLFSSLSCSTTENEELGIIDDDNVDDVDIEDDVDDDDDGFTLSLLLSSEVGFVESFFWRLLVLSLSCSSLEMTFFSLLSVDFKGSEPERIGFEVSIFSDLLSLLFSKEPEAAVVVVVVAVAVTVGEEEDVVVLVVMVFLWDKETEEGSGGSYWESEDDFVDSFTRSFLGLLGVDEEEEEEEGFNWTFLSDSVVFEDAVNDDDKDVESLICKLLDESLGISNLFSEVDAEELEEEEEEESSDDFDMESVLLSFSVVVEIDIMN